MFLLTGRRLRETLIWFEKGAELTSYWRRQLQTLCVIISWPLTEPPQLIVCWENFRS